jgi:ABC-type Fe3+/spermidine/putrescine transport system ATPase subunit
MDLIPALSIQAPGKSYGPVHVLKDISAQTAKGECLGLLGPSGCGKSTLLT